MLVLCRRVGEKICIGGNICVTVVDIDRGKVRLGVEAPGDVLVMRQELVSRPGEPYSRRPIPGPHRN
jgi:carbon storage regulator